MIKKILVLFTCLALAAAFADTYRVTLFQPSELAGKQLKPGDYKLELKDGKVTLVKGKEVVEAPVKVETSDQKFSATSVRYSNGDGKMKIQEIRLGGTKTKLVFAN
jgi:hypothetical protein